MNIDYTNEFYCFDTETTTFYSDSGEAYTDVYLASFLKVPFILSQTQKDIEAIEPIFNRDWNQINSQIEYISAHTPRGYYQIIYVHNLAYDWDGLVKNCDFIKNNYNNRSTQSLYIKSRKPLFVRIKNIEFRCSYRFLNNNLRTLGKIYDYPKLEIDYEQQFFSFSKLPQSEYEYNVRDVRCQAFAILQECKKYPYIETLQDVPLTNTSLTRKLNQFINSRKDNKSYKDRNMYAVKEYGPLIDTYEQVYQGAYTHGNAYDIGKVLTNISSIDITSSYPDSMLHRDYPYHFKKAKKKVKQFFEYTYYKYNKKTFNECLMNIRRPFEYAFFGKFTFRNLKCKVFQGNVQFPTLSFHKILNHPVCTLDNGRIINASEVQIYLNHIDFFIFDNFYEYELVNVEDLYYTQQFRPLHPFIIKVVEQYAHEKTIYKKIHIQLKMGQKLTEQDFYCEKIQDFICSEEVRKSILKLPEAEQKNTINRLLMSAKNRLNAQYGILVQRIFQENYVYDIEDDTFSFFIDKTLPRNLYRNFEEGLFITAYSRLTLFSMADFLLQYGLRPIYSDTDSWKVDGNPAAVRKAVQNFNDIIENSAHNSELYGIGFFDFEGTYKYFSMLGSKKYLCADDKNIECTIAGVPKLRMSDIFTQLYAKYDYDFQAFCDDCFKPCTLLSYSAIQKLSCKFYQNSFDGVVKDSNGEYGYIQFNNMVELYKTDYTLIDTNNKANADYIRYLEYVQDRHISQMWSEIYVNDEEEAEVRYLEEYKKDYHLINDYMENTLNYFKEDL